MGALVSCCLKLGLDLRIMTSGSKQDRRQNLQSLLSDKDSGAVSGHKKCAPPTNIAVNKAGEDPYNKARNMSRLGEQGSLAGDRSPTSPCGSAKSVPGPWNKRDKKDNGRDGQYGKRQVSFGTFTDQRSVSPGPMN